MTRGTPSPKVDETETLIRALVRALAIMVDHAEEQYPHFESPRGQSDIMQAKAALKLAGCEE